MRLTKTEKKKIKKALFSAAVDGNVQAAKLLLGFSADAGDDDPFEKMSDEELRREKERLINQLKT